MRYLSAIFFAVALAACVFSSTHSVAADPRIKLGDGRASFIPSSNLKQLTKEQIAASKYPKNNPPEHVFANDSQTVSVAVTMSAVPLQPNRLEEYRQANGQLLRMAIENVQFLAQDIITINGRKCVHLKL